MDGGMKTERDILVHCRQQAAVCEAQGHTETHLFLTALADEIEFLRAQLAMQTINRDVLAAADSVVADRVNGHG